MLTSSWGSCKMKFKVIAYTNKDNRFVPCGYVGEYHIQSLCGKYKTTLSSYEYNMHLKDGVIYYHGTSAITRVFTRLSKIGVDVEFSCNYPWVYLEKVNGVQVTEVKNSEHRYCITYATDQRHLRLRKDLFKKIREIINEHI